MVPPHVIVRLRAAAKMAFSVCFGIGRKLKEDTPKSVLKLMGIQGLTLYHLKSHFQERKIQEIYVVGPAGDVIGETNGTHMSNPSVSPQINKNLQISEAIHMQIEVQRRLHEQLEVQRHLQIIMGCQLASRFKALIGIL